MSRAHHSAVLLLVYPKRRKAILHCMTYSKCAPHKAMNTRAIYLQALFSITLMTNLSVILKYDRSVYHMAALSAILLSVLYTWNLNCIVNFPIRH